MNEKGVKKGIKKLSDNKVRMTAFGDIGVVVRKGKERKVKERKGTLIIWGSLILTLTPHICNNTMQIKINKQHK